MSAASTLEPSRACVLACRCEQCTATPGPTYTEAFRHECEVRHVARMASKSARKAYLSGVAVQRGWEAVERIIAGLRRVARERAA